MQEKELISKIKSLKEIKPNENWVALTRESVFDKKEKAFVFPLHSIFGKPAMAALASFGFIFALVVSAQNATPGESLYTIKRITERGQMTLVSQDGKQDFNLFLAHRRLDEISEIVKRDEIERLASAIEELELMKSRLQKDFAQSIESKSKEEVVEIARNFAPSILEIEDKEDLVIGSLGVKTEDEIPSSTAKDLASLLIEDLENRSLTEKDQELLSEAKNDYEEKNYRNALRNALRIGQEREESEEDEDEDIKDDGQEDQN